MSVLTETGDLVAGDLIATPLPGLLPRRPWNPPFHDDPLTNLTSLRRMLDLGLERPHTGHGGMLDPERVQEQRRLERLEGRLRRHNQPGTESGVMVTVRSAGSGAPPRPVIMPDSWRT